MSLVPHEPNHDFRFTVSSSDPELVEVSPGEFEWLPKLRQSAYIIGLNGVTRTSDEIWRRERTRNGSVIIEPEDYGPDGYVRTAKSKRGGTHYYQAWVTLRQSGGRKLEPQRDLAAKHDFQRRIMQRYPQTIPDPEFVQSSIDLIENSLESLRTRSTRLPHLAKDVKVREERLKRHVDAFEALKARGGKSLHQVASEESATKIAVLRNYEDVLAPVMGGDVVGKVRKAAGVSARAKLDDMSIEDLRAYVDAWSAHLAPAKAKAPKKPEGVPAK